MHNTHSEMLCHVASSLKWILTDESAWVRFQNEPEAYLALLSLDLTPARSILAPCYAQRKGGRAPRDPLVLLRCFVAMALFGVSSFHRWTKRLRSEPELRLVCGFDRDDRGPGPSTLYDFVRRIADGPWKSNVPKNQRNVSQWLGARNQFRRNLRKEKLSRHGGAQSDLAQKAESKVTAWVDCALKNWSRAVPTTFAERLNRILHHCAVSTSAAKGLLGSLSQLCITMDGSALPSQARRRGKALCECKVNSQRDVPKKAPKKDPPQDANAVAEETCEHDRLYADPLATFGWDSHREQYYFGHRMHAMFTYHNGIDLPVYISVDGAHQPDVLAGLNDLEVCSKMLRRLHERMGVGHVIADIGYDAAGFYRLIEHLGAAAVIPLHPNTKNVAPVSRLPLSENGAPLCPGSLEMRYHGYHRRHQTHVYHCPIKRPGKRDGKPFFRVHAHECPLAVLCEPDSKMGPLLRLKSADDPRLNPRIPRQSQLFKDLYKRRTGTERFNSLVKVAGNLGDRPYRRRHLFEWMLLAHGLATHAKQWVKWIDGIPKSPAELITFCERLAHEAQASKPPP